MLRTFGDRTDGRFQIQFRGMNLGLIAQGHGPKARCWMGGIGDAKLAAHGKRWHTGMVCHADNIRVRNGPQQVTDEIVKLHVGDEMCGLLISHRPAQHAGKTEQRVAAASQTVRPAVGADQLTLDTECGGLQRDKADVLEGRAVNSLAKHDC
jgi:hypothetical protein